MDEIIDALKRGTLPRFAGELQFRRYSDTSTQGPSVVFGLHDRDDLQAFVGMEGKRFSAVLIEIGDDEQPVQAPDKPKGGELAKLAGRFCQNQEFWLFLTDVHAAHAHTADDAALFIRQFCGIKSRSELDHDERAALLFDEHFRRAFLDWQVANP